MPDAVQVKNLAAGLPDEPGVYLMKDGAGSIIYIGKASSLRKRVASYFRKSGLDPKTRVLVGTIRDIEFIVTDSEVEALLLESVLIRKHTPKFNIQKKDDKRYPYIAVTLDEEYPRVIFTRSLRGGGNRYFGPYTDARAARKTVALINSVFKLKVCTRDIPLKRNERPCMNFQINRCGGVCRGIISRDEYMAIIGTAIRFLEGNIEPVISDLREMMNRFSEERAYEKASEIRDMIFDIQKISENQKVHVPVGMDRDFIGISRRGGEAIAVLFEFRQGVLLGRKIAVFDNAEYAGPAEIIGAFMTDHYQSADIPPRIVIDHVLPDRAVLQKFLSGRAARKVSIRRPETSDDRGIIRLIQKNIDIIIAERDADRRNAESSSGLVELGRLLGMEDPPRYIECFDISNLQGEDAVASMVSFRDGKPFRSGYRRYRIRGHESANDPGMIHEVVARRVQHLVNEELDLPDLMVVDGGAAQLSRAIEAAGNFTDALRIISIAKRFEEIYLDPRTAPVRLEKNSPALRIITHMRDEAHRFAISYHRRVRDRSTSASELDEAPVGKKAATRLLAHFKSVEGIRKATVEDLDAVPGIGAKTARALYEYFH